jgi:DNA-binding MarR family transcriptional regulator
MNIPWQNISEFKGPEDSPGFKLWRITMEWRRRIEAALNPLKLTHTQFVLLANIGWLTRNGDTVTQIQLARHCGTNITMTSQVLRSFERRGLIERRARPNDDRAKHPHITPAGAALVAQAIPLVEAIDRQFFPEYANQLAALHE